MGWLFAHRKTALAYAALTDIGRRHKANEDAVAVVVPPEDAQWGFDLAAIVCDGVSGQPRGDVASTLSIEAFRATLSQADDRPIADRLAVASAAASASILDFAQREVQGAPVASTVVVLVIAGPTATIGHVGNSRAYLVRDGKMRLLTHDHSVVADSVREGIISAEQARWHPDRSRINRALGAPGADVMEVDVCETQEHDLFLLSSDGLHDVIGEDKIAGALSDDLDATARRLIDLANAAGGPDNISVVLCRMP